ncbi:penicillin acylase family protein [Burkholderiaceae bacterium DAT-1]|nr:penicillin acylase family protein [Burkholderiaceae bacterium DAT-1]
MYKLRRVALGVVGLCLVLTLILAALFWAALHASLPAIDGTIKSAQVSAPLRIVRDRLGIVTVEAGNRADAAWALGYAHASDRYFQMDLLRRNAAGEISALIGAAALPVDREHRLHRLRARAHQAWLGLPAQEKALLQHYADGVNAGLSALKGRPFEYWLLRNSPKPWLPEDSLLVIYTMYFELQGHQADRELSRGWLVENCNDAQLEFLLPESSKWDAPIDESIQAPGHVIPQSAPLWWRGATTQAGLKPLQENFPGSNNFAVSGKRSLSGSAILADDMHLGIRLPNTWYRAVLRWQERAHEVAQISGVSLPGAPAIVAGSNGRVAWGFTNSYGDWLDLVRLERHPEDHLRYRGQKEWEQLVPHKEVIEVNHGNAETLTVLESRYGPVRVVGGESFAMRWVAHDAGRAVNLGLMGMEHVRTAEEALAVGQRSGIPAQNLLVADQSGHIGWTIAGPMPKRVVWGERNTVPLAVDTPHLGWEGYLAPTAYPQLLDPPAGQLWTANSRQLAGDQYALIGDGGADLGARSRQIRDDLTSLHRVTERDLLNVQLDDRALLLNGWHDRLIALLDADSLRGKPMRREARELVASWTGRAAPSDAGYHIVRAWRDSIYQGMFGRLDEELRKVDPDLRYNLANPRWEVVAETLLDKTPEAWLPLGYQDWQQFQLAQLDRVLDTLLKEHKQLKLATWGQANRSEIAHPFVRFMPWMKWLLATPADELAGDKNVPRVVGSDFGASERLVISPGHEEHAIFHMPGGQSGNPLSPFFLAGHEAWVKGDPSPLLPQGRAYVFNIEPSPAK